MTIPLSAAMEDARASTEKSPLISIEFEGIPVTFGLVSIDKRETIKFGQGIKFGDTNPETGVIYKFGDTVSVAGATVDTVKRKAMSGFGSEVRPHQGSASIAGFSIPILHTDELSDILADYPMMGRKVTAFAGFRNVPSSEWVAIQTGIVADLNPWPDHLGWTFQARDIQREARKDAFLLKKTKLKADIPATGPLTFVEIEEAAGFEEVLVTAAIGHFRIDAEVFSYTGVDTTTTPHRLTGITREVAETVEGAHRTGRAAEELFHMRGNPIDLGRQLLTSINGDGVNGPFDVFPSRIGLGVDQSFIHGTRFTEVALDVGGDFEFWIDRKEDGKSWLEREIYKVNNCYPVVLGDGRLSLKLFEPPIQSEELFVFNTDTNIRKKTVRVDGNLTETFNQATWLFDWNPGAKDFEASRTVDDPDSQTKYGVRRPITLESRGLRSEFGGDAAAISRSQRLFTRFADPPVALEFEAFYETFHVEPGDLALFVDPRPLNPRTGRRGFPGIVVEVASKSPNYGTGRMRFRVLYTPFAGFRYGRWADEAQQDYAPLAAAAAGGDAVAQGIIDTYVFIASEAINPEGEMSNGDPPYRYQ